MSKSDPPKKANSSNSYSLLLKGLSEIEKKTKTKPGEAKESTSKNSKMNRKDDKGDKRASEPNQKKDAPEKPSNPDEPDRSFGDYYCRICDSHMNSDNMWEAHVTGKRHIKNVKKGENDSKYEDLPDEESAIKYELRNVKDPIIGLAYIHEIRRKEPNVPPLYNCFLCHASLATPPLVIEHVISLKHRMNYIKENNPEEYLLLEGTNLKKGSLEPLVYEAAVKLEEKDGRGVVKVKQERIKAPIVTWKRKDSDDEDDLPWKHPKKTKTDDKQSSFKSRDIDRRSPSPRSFRDYKDRPSYYSDEGSRDSFARSSSRRGVSPRRDASPRRDDHHRSSRYSDRDDFNRTRSSEYDIRRSDYDARRLDYDTRRSEYDTRRDDYETRRFDHDKLLRKDYNLSPPPNYGQTSLYASDRATSSSDRYRSPVNELSANQSHDNLLPHERVMEQPQVSQQAIFQNFVQKIMDLPPDIFLKLVLVKMDTMLLQGIEELSLLSRVINVGQDVLKKQIPPELKAVIAQKPSQSKEPAPSSPSSQVSTEQNQKASALSAQSFINELLTNARNASNAAQQVSAPMNNGYIPPQVPPPTIQANQNLPYPNANQPQYAAAASSVRFPNANNPLQFPNSFAPRPAQNFAYNSQQPSTSNNIRGLPMPQQGGTPAPQAFNNFQNYPSSTNKNYRY